jgi:hypothetical protein
VPLISLCTDFFSSEEREQWSSQVRSVLAFFRRAIPYAPRADTFGRAIWKLLEASKSVARKSEEDYEDEDKQGEDMAFLGAEEAQVQVKDEDQDYGEQKDEPPRPTTAMMVQHPATQQFMMDTSAPIEVRMPLGDMRNLSRAGEIRPSPSSSPLGSYAVSFAPTLSIHSSMVASAPSQSGRIQPSAAEMHHHPHAQFAVPQVTATPFDLDGRSMLVPGSLTDLPSDSGTGTGLVFPQMHHHHQHHHQHHHHFHNPTASHPTSSAHIQGSQQMYQQNQQQQVLWDGMVWESYPEDQQAAEAQRLSLAQQQSRQSQGFINAEGIFGQEQSESERHDSQQTRQGSQAGGSGNANWSFSS